MPCQTTRHAGPLTERLEKLRLYEPRYANTVEIKNYNQPQNIRDSSVKWTAQAISSKNQLSIQQDIAEISYLRGREDINFCLTANIL